MGAIARVEKARRYIAEFEADYAKLYAVKAPGFGEAYLSWDDTNEQSVHVFYNVEVPKGEGVESLYLRLEEAGTIYVPDRSCADELERTSEQLGLPLQEVFDRFKKADLLTGWLAHSPGLRAEGGP